MSRLVKHVAAEGRSPICAGVVRLWRALINGLLFALFVLPSAVAAEEYHLAPGDVLRVMIVGEPDLTVDVPIEMDGSAWFPLVGPIAAGGETLRDARSRTAEAYATMSLNRPIKSGTGLPRIIETNQVLVTVTAYRPIYVTGNVGAMREVPYRPGLTLRHLSALTGTVPSQTSGRPAAIGEIDAAAAALAKEFAQVWRQKTFLGIDTPADFDRIFVAEGTEFDEFVAVERSILAETRAALETQKQELRGQISRAEESIAALVRQKDNEAASFKIDEEGLATVQDLFSRNLVPASRLTEVRRASLVTASRLFQIEVALENARGQVATLEGRIHAVDSDARVAAWNELGDALTRVQQRRSDLETLLASAGRSQLAGLFPAETKAIITRDGVTLAPGETSPSLMLMPGDIVEFRRLPVSSSAPILDGEAKR